MPTSRLSRSLKEAIEWLLLGMFLGCALNMNATVTEYKSNKQSWHCVEKECTNGKRTVSLAEGSKEGRLPPPAEIVVDGERFSITVKADLGKNLLGTTVVATKQIEIKAGQILAVEKDTVLHECIHAAFGSDFKDLTGKKWGEEQATYWLTPRLLKIITSNPKLMEYLTQP